MANNFTASVIPILRAKLDTIFKSKATVNPELTNVPVAATAVLENQTANIVPLYEGAGSACVGVKVLYNVADDTSAATVSATPISSDCALTSGDTMSTAAQDYDFNIFIKEISHKMTDLLDHNSLSPFIIFEKSCHEACQRVKT